MTDWAEARVHTVKFWINAFIHPAHIDGPPGAGLLYNYEYFSGDNRSYSSEIHASSRLHSEVEISGLNTGSPQINFQWHDCGESHALDSHLTVVDHKKATARASFDAPVLHDDGTTTTSSVHIHYVGAAAMPLLKGSPDIDASGTFTVNPFSGEVSFDGMIDSYPWFEAYTAVNNGAPFTVFTAEPTGDGPVSLYGDANRPISGCVFAS